MATESEEVKITRYIDDAIALEAASITALRDMAEDAISTEERALYEGHLAESERHKLHLEERLVTLGGGAKRHLLKDVMNSIGTAATNLLHAGKNDDDKSTRNLLQAYAMESLEVAVYEALYAAANSNNDTETALLARQIQAEESAMAKKLFFRISDSSVIALRSNGSNSPDTRDAMIRPHSEEQINAEAAQH